MASRKSRKRARRRERRKAKASGWGRAGKSKMGRIGHGAAGGRCLGGPARIHLTAKARPAGWARVRGPRLVWNLTIPESFSLALIASVGGGVERVSV